mmetsp:Transcript_41698/g.63720  ORF Transcript_41698/g.63720 Transcript_41698/m.63720 type:complete len:106 (-) Transcript_41698:223-540(-)
MLFKPYPKLLHIKIDGWVEHADPSSFMKCLPFLFQLTDLIEADDTESARYVLTGMFGLYKDKKLFMGLNRLKDNLLKGKRRLDETGFFTHWQPEVLMYSRYETVP